MVGYDWKNSYSVRLNSQAEVNAKLWWAVHVVQVHLQRNRSWLAPGLLPYPPFFTLWYNSYPGTTKIKKCKKHPRYVIGEDFITGFFTPYIRTAISWNSYPGNLTFKSARNLFYNDGQKAKNLKHLICWFKRKSTVIYSSTLSCPFSMIYSACTQSTPTPLWRQNILSLWWWLYK